LEFGNLDSGIPSLRQKKFKNINAVKMKKTSWILIIILFTGFSVFAQDQKPKEEENEKEKVEENSDRRSEEKRYEPRQKERKYGKGEIKTLSGNNYHSGGFGAISFKGTKFMGETLMMGGFRGGWSINRVVALGFEGWGFIPTVSLSDVYQFNEVVLLGGYGGFFIEPIVFSNEIVHVTFPVSGGAGWMGYNENFYNYDNTNFLVDDDVFWYIEPGIALEVNVSRSFRMDFGASQRFTQDLELLNTPKDEFDGWSYFLTLKFGRF